MSAESQLGREMSHSPFRLCTQQKEIQINKLPCFAKKNKKKKKEKKKEKNHSLDMS
jgi:hypothetical protein